MFSRTPIVLNLFRLLLLTEKHARFVFYSTKYGLANKSGLLECLLTFMFSLYVHYVHIFCSVIAITNFVHQVYN